MKLSKGVLLEEFKRRVCAIKGKYIKRSIMNMSKGNHKRKLKVEFVNMKST